MTFGNAALRKLCYFLLKVIEFALQSPARPASLINGTKTFFIGFYDRRGVIVCLVPAVNRESVKTKPAEFGQGIYEAGLDRIEDMGSAAGVNIYREVAEIGRASCRERVYSGV